MKQHSKICSKGVWDDTVPGISFDDNGVSNFCKLQEYMMEKYPRGAYGKTQWENLVKKIKEDGKKNRYDCIVGVSGGVDSSYLLYTLKEKYGLRPLAVNLDNGFNTDIALKNIYNVTNSLDIDLETYVIDYEEVKDLLKSYMRASLSWIDKPTDLAIKAVMYKLASKENVKYIIRGNDFRSEGKQPKEWTYADKKQLKYIHSKFGEGVKLKTFPIISFYKMSILGLIHGIKDVRPFYYINYSKQEAKSFLESEFDWQYYGGHHHENYFTRFTMAYWLPKKFNIDKRKINLSAQILSGAITRREAIEELNKPFDTEEELEQLKQYILKKLEMSEKEFLEIWNKPNRKIFDFPSNYKLIYNSLNRVKFLLNKLYDHKPMSAIEKEFIQ